MNKVTHKSKKSKRYFERRAALMEKQIEKALKNKKRFALISGRLLFDAINKTIMRIPANYSAFMNDGKDYQGVSFQDVVFRGNGVNVDKLTYEEHLKAENEYREEQKRKREEQKRKGALNA